MLTDCTERSAAFTYPDTAKLAVAYQCKINLLADACRFLSLHASEHFLLLLYHSGVVRYQA